MRPPRALAEGRPIWGLAVLDKELYVARSPPAELTVYDTGQYHVRRRLIVSGTKDVTRLDIAVCPVRRYIYVVTNASGCQIHRYSAKVCGLGLLLF